MLLRIVLAKIDVDFAPIFEYCQEDQIEREKVRKNPWAVVFHSAEIPTEGMTPFCVLTTSADVLWTTGVFPEQFPVTYGILAQFSY